MKNSINKIKLFLIQNWSSILLGLSIIAVGFMFFRQFSFEDSYNKMLTKKYTEQADSFKKQINKIQQVNDERFKLQEELLKSYELKIKEIDEKYQKNIDEILKKQQKNQLKIVEDAKNNPDTLTNKINETYLIPIFKKQ